MWSAGQDDVAASNGHGSVDAQDLGISISIVFRRAETNVTVQRALEENGNQSHDLAEQRLIEAVDRGEP